MARASRRRSALRLACSLLLACAAHAGAARAGSVYYVNALTGRDTNSGTSPEATWRTIQKAAVTLVAGDTVQIMSGVYGHEVVPLNSGEPDAWITYQAYGDGPVVIRLTRFPVRLPPDRRVEYLRFAGLTLDGGRSADRRVSYGVLVDRTTGAKSQLSMRVSGKRMNVIVSFPMVE